jgi:hypothetical protein
VLYPSHVNNDPDDGHVGQHPTDDGREYIDSIRRGQFGTWFRFDVDGPLIYGNTYVTHLLEVSLTILTGEAATPEPVDVVMQHESLTWGSGSGGA